MKQKLQQAQFALEQLKAQRGNTYYPDFHLAPPAGWMNDPNGLIYFDGLYHAFYQHHPMSADWGPLHWGHATSHDMIHWQHQPIALAPGDDYDRDGCFSGCAVNDNGTLSLIYTGHVWLKEAGDDSAIREVQCLATSTDGIHFEKQGIVLTPPDGIMHFRDPKIWQENGTWWMVLGARDVANCGQTLLYKGNSLREWQLDRILANADVDGGYMWECPDFFPCGDHHYLMFSPQGIQQNTGYQYRNRFQSGVIQGHWQEGSAFIQSQKFTELDNGHDFYAPQSFTTADGRRVIMAWMDMWESAMPSKQEGWAGCLTLPRELFVQDGHLCQRPVIEAKSLRQQSQLIEPHSVSQTEVLLDHSSAIELELVWDINQSNAERYGIALGNKVGDGLELYIDSQSQRLVLWRHYSEYELDGYRSIPLPASDKLSLRIFIDRSSVEVFVNDGDAAMSSRIYPQPNERKLMLFASHGSAVISEGTLWQLK